ncbi:MAG: phosphopantetheine-binding protein [Prevotellaceae bacterium]|jgi:acyl carrier protein|nr:phosphopantetheine-binding protein [Prevotellaceae bacterium]
MEKDDFLKNFANQFDDTDISELSFETNFRDLDEWSSLIALAVMNMVAKKYGAKLRPDEMKLLNTIQELYDLVAEKL